MSDTYIELSRAAGMDYNKWKRRKRRLELLEIERKRNQPLLDKLFERFVEFLKGLKELAIAISEVVIGIFIVAFILSILSSWLNDPPSGPPGRFEVFDDYR